MTRLSFFSISYEQHLFLLGYLPSYLSLKYSKACPNDHLWITATCQQWPVWSHNNQPEAYLPRVAVVHKFDCTFKPVYNHHSWDLKNVVAMQRVVWKRPVVSEIQAGHWSFRWQVSGGPEVIVKTGMTEILFQNKD